MSSSPRFVLISHHRSGSNLVTLALRAQQSIAMLGEVLGHEPDLDGEEYLRRGIDGADYVRSVWTRYAHPPATAVGFKAHYTHARGSAAAATAWAELCRDREIWIIHLYRENLLEALISLETARRNNEWMRVPTSSGPGPIKPFILGAKQCTAYFERTLRYREWIREDFSNHRMLELEYQADLCRSYSESMTRLLRFLRVPPIPIKRQLAKQASDTISQSLTNFLELRAEFQSSPYLKYFDEQQHVEIAADPSIIG